LPSWTTNNPRLVLGPVVNPVGTFFPIQESDLDQCVYKQSRLAIPVGSDLNVFHCHAPQVSLGMVIDHPEDQAQKAPTSFGA
jgi:hypothetical protein